MSKKSASFEDNMQRLETIVKSLEGGEISLEESMKLFEEGIALADLCNKTLTEAELKVSRLSGVTENGPVIEEIDEDELF